MILRRIRGRGESMTTFEPQDRLGVILGSSYADSVDLLEPAHRLKASLLELTVVDRAEDLSLDLMKVAHEIDNALRGLGPLGAEIHELIGITEEKPFRRHAFYERSSIILAELEELIGEIAKFH